MKYEGHDATLSLIKTSLITVFLGLFFSSFVFGNVVTSLGQPCRAKSLENGIVVKDTSRNKEWLVLTNSNAYEWVELIFIDFKILANSTVVQIPRKSFWTSLVGIPGNRIVLGLNWGQLIVFDYSQGVMAVTKEVNINEELTIDELNIFNVVWGGERNGKEWVYAGTGSKGAKLIAYNLTDNEVKICGGGAKPSSEDTMLRCLSTLPGGKVYCRFLMSRIGKVYNPDTDSFESFPTIEGVDLTNERFDRGVTWNNYFLIGDWDVGHYAFLSNSLIPQTSMPFPEPSGDWRVNVIMTNDSYLYLEEIGLSGTKTIYKYGIDDLQLTTIFTDINFNGSSIRGISESGDILGSIGQGYFCLSPGATSLERHEIPVATSPRPIFYLRAENCTDTANFHTRLWGGPSFGQVPFWLDIQEYEENENEVTSYPAFTDVSGELYDLAFLNGKVYAVSYSQGEIFVFDPNQGFILGTNPSSFANPKPGPDYIRPNAGILVGPDGKLYSGWQAKYGVYGGAVAITDPTQTNDNTLLLENPLGINQEVYSLAVNDNGHYLFIGTSLDGNGLSRKTGEPPRLGVIDLSSPSHTMVFFRDFPHAVHVGPMVYDALTNKVVVAIDGQIAVFDAGSDPENWTDPEFWDGIPPVTSTRISGRGNGKIYYGSNTSVICADLSMNTFNIITEMPNNINQITAHTDGMVYVACGKDLYQIHAGISGTVELQDWVGPNNDGSPEGITVEVQLQNQASIIITTHTATLDGNGEFTITGIAAGTYNVRIKASHWLAVVQEGLVVNGGNTTIATPFSLVNGDIDGDNQIGATDYAAWNNSNNTGPNDPNWNPNADLDGDEYIDLSDYIIWNKNMDQTGDEFFTGSLIVSGTVAYDINGVEGYPLNSVVIELHQGSTVETHNVILTGTESPKSYSFTTTLDGTCDMVIPQNFQTGWFGDDSNTGVSLIPATTVNFSLTHAMPGDADMDGMVYDSDVDILNGNYGIVDGTAFWCMGDFDDDGNIYDSDLDILIACYGLGVE